jgi:FixJ family two-component response regulator
MTGPPMIVVVDDDSSARRGLERLLRTGGYRVVTFSSALEFLAAEGLHEIGCLVLDVRMPGLSGLDLQDLLAMRSRRVPIVFISGHSDISVVVRAMKAGASDFLPKPFEDEALFRAIEQAMQAPKQEVGPDETGD